jgi:hypothetical protein
MCEAAINPKQISAAERASAKRFQLLERETSVEEKEKIFPSSKKIASRQDEKNSAWERGCFWLCVSNSFALRREKEILLLTSIK